MSIQFNAYTVFEIGIQIETNGKLFYLEAAKGASNDALRSLFTELAAWEEQHIDIFRDLQTALPEEILDDALFDPEDEAVSYMKAAAESHVFVATPDMARLVAEQCQSELQALDMALAFEKDSVIYYTTMKKVVAKHLGQEKIDQLIDEELKHISILQKRKHELS